MGFSGFGGIDAARERTTEIDRRILDAIAATGGDLLAGDKVALVGVGSYGRRELAPDSDIDLLVLHSLKDPEHVGAATKAIVYPLWDKGFEVGYAVRTVGECLKTAKDDEIIATTLLDARLVAGNAELVESLQNDLDRRHKKRRDALERSLLIGLAERHARFGDAGVDIEPHLKEGRGGLRDLQLLRWLDVIEPGALDGPLDLLLAVRDALHAAAGKKQDRLTREFVEPVAQRLGIDADCDTDEDVRDILMRIIYDRCRIVGAQLGWYRQERLHPPKKYRAPAGFKVIDARLSRDDELPPAADPAAGFAAAIATRDIAPSRELATWAHTDGAPPAWNDELRSAAEAFLATATATGWEFLDVTGLWLRYFPDFAGARAKVQHNPLHSLTVDAHCWETLHESRRIEHEDGLRSQVYAEFGNPAALHLAALMHDMGKGEPGDHSRSGVIIARHTLERMGYGADIQELVAFSIQHHLLLSEFATGRDLNDEELVTRLASKIGSIDRLQLLYLLTIADSRATGSTVWSGWKATLLDELYVKCAHVLAQGDLLGRDAQNVHERTVAEVVRDLEADGMPHDAALALVGGFPRRYLLAQPSARIVAHVHAVQDVLDGSVPARVVGGDDRIIFVAPDESGLLATIAGVLAIHGVSVRTADIYTRSDDIAVDVMTVADTVAGSLDAGLIERIERDLLGAIDGSLDLPARVSDRAARYDRPGPVTLDVTIDNAASDWYSIIEIDSSDRVGLLYDIATVLADANLDVHFSKIMTLADTARDTFSVRDLDGNKPRDVEGLTAQIEEGLAARVSARLGVS